MNSTPTTDECVCGAVMPADARDHVNGLHEQTCHLYDPQGDDTLEDES